jgi:hypothetical protein
LPPNAEMLSAAMPEHETAYTPSRVRNRSHNFRRFHQVT